MSKDKKLINGILASTIFVLLSLIYYFFGHCSLLSSILIISIYLLVVPLLFFTFGAYIEKLSVTEQVKVMTDKIKKTKNAAGVSVDFPTIPPASSSDDDEAKESNKEIINNSLTILIPSFAGGLVLFFGLKYYFTRIRKKDINGKGIAREVLLFLIVIIIVEMLFFSLITKNYRALTTNQVMDEINEQVHEP